MLRIEGFIGGLDTSASILSEKLSALEGKAVSLVINSAGGDAFEGAAMLAELRAYQGKVIVHIRGIAASAASLITMGADRILIDRDAVFMIHDPSAMTFGPPAAHRRSADDLDKLANTYAAAYARRSRNDPARVREWMISETWLNAEEAVALGFADAIEDDAAEMVARFDYTKFAHAPQQLAAITQAKGWTALPSDNARRDGAPGP